MQAIKLRQHQTEMLNATLENSKGVLQAPTGSGKTFAQAARVVKEIQKGAFQLVIISSPRIGLSNQLSREYLKFFHQNEDSISSSQYRAMLAHSGDGVEMSEDETDLEALKEQLLSGQDNVEATTSVERIREVVAECERKGITAIIFTTYHSTVKVSESVNRVFSLHINDEAHYLTREDFAPILENTQAENRFFFTATPIVGSSESGRGMNNVERFGEKIYAMPVRAAIDKELIVRPRAMVLRSNNLDVSQQDVDGEIGEIALHAFNNARNEYPELGAKMLIATRGSKQIEYFLASAEINEMIDEGVEVLTVHSNADLITHNGNKITRKEFEKLKDEFGNDVDKELVIVHYDILSEGIDIPGLTGVLIMRNLKLAKFLQTIGRVLRVYRKNPELKPSGLVMFPDITDADMRVDFVRMLKNLVDEGFLSEQQLSDSLTMGSLEEEDEDRRELSDPRSLREDVDMMLYAQSLEEIDFLA